ncbi:hypothetical protein SY91_05188 [Burkholderia cenocepacia]|nr:hypothetical protein SY91_05188 [Burkholderia cenocepacia]
MSTIARRPPPARRRARRAARRRTRARARTPDRTTVGGTPGGRIGADRQQPGQRDVVQVVPGRGCQRSILAPAGHAPVDQLRIAARANVGPEAEPLHHAGPQALDQRIGLRDQIERGVPPGRRLQVEFDDVLAFAQQVAVAGPQRVRCARAAGRARDQRDARAHAGEHPAGERAGAEPFEFDDVDAGKRRVQWHGDLAEMQSEQGRRNFPILCECLRAPASRDQRLFTPITGLRGP